MKFHIAQLTKDGFAALVSASEPFVVLQPVGSVEPHGPHLSLITDCVISEAASERAVARLYDVGIVARIAPTIPYGVTECAKAFPGAVSVPGGVLSALLVAVADGYLRSGADHVCFVNNHLEPAHDAAVRFAGADSDQISVACPLTRRWARTLSDEFKRGECHAGRYETAIMMAAAPELVDEPARRGLPEVPLSLSEKLRSGITDFAEMGLSDAYAGAPALATAEEGSELLDKLADMIVGEVTSAL